MDESKLKEHGFENTLEFNRMIAAVDLTTAKKQAAFKKWQDEDGTKDGLAKLPIQT